MAFNCWARFRHLGVPAAPSGRRGLVLPVYIVFVRESRLKPSSADDQFARNCAGASSARPCFCRPGSTGAPPAGAICLSARPRPDAETSPTPRSPEMRFKRPGARCRSPSPRRVARRAAVGQSRTKWPGDPPRSPVRPGARRSGLRLAARSGIRQTPAPGSAR